MSMNKYANAGPNQAAMASSIDFSKPLTVSVSKSNGALVLSKPVATPAAKMEEPAAYPGLSDVEGQAVRHERLSAYPGLTEFELRRMIENLADQVSELAAANVELRQRITAIETAKPAWTWAI